MRVFFTHWYPFGVCWAYIDPFIILTGVRQSLNMPIYTFLNVFQLREIKEANQQVILNALKHPNANITKLLEETEEKYRSKSFVADCLKNFQHLNLGFPFSANS